MGSGNKCVKQKKLLDDKFNLIKRAEKLRPFIYNNESYICSVLNKENKCLVLYYFSQYMSEYETLTQKLNETEDFEKQNEIHKMVCQQIYNLNKMGILHNDLNFGNILISKDNNIIFIDWELCTEGTEDKSPDNFIEIWDSYNKKDKEAIHLSKDYSDLIKYFIDNISH